MCVCVFVYLVFVYLVLVLALLACRPPLYLSLVDALQSPNSHSCRHMGHVLRLLVSRDALEVSANYDVYLESRTTTQISILE